MKDQKSRPVAKRRGRKKSAKVQVVEFSPIKDRGGFVMMLEDADLGDHPKPEGGPTINISERKDIDCWTFMAVAQLVAGGTHTKVLGVSQNGIESTVAVFMPLVAPNDRQLMAAAGSLTNITVTLDHVVRAKKNIRWVTTSLQGAEFIAYVRRVVDLAAPDAVMVWPVEYYLGSDMGYAGKALLEETDWLLPRQKKQAGGNGIDYHRDEDDPQDWWKPKE